MFDGCFPSLEALSPENFHTMYFIASQNIYALWTQKLNSSKLDLRLSFDKLAKTIGNPEWTKVTANYTNVSGLSLKCNCWQGKVIQIGCSSVRQKICKQQCSFPPFYKIAKSQISNKKQVMVLKCIRGGGVGCQRGIWEIFLGGWGWSGFLALWGGKRFHLKGGGARGEIFEP